MGQDPLSLHNAPSRLRDWVRLLRPAHWLKNVFLLAPAVFSEHVTDPMVLASAVLGFLCFCPLCSGMYIFNDLIDRPSDAQHPRKQKRPVASGRIGPWPALLAASGLLIAAGAVGWWLLPPKFLAFMAAYALNTLVYIVWLKNRVIVDVLLIAVGFVIRLLAGCAAVAVEPSSWLLVCGFSLALVLGFGKRRAEVQLVNVTDGYRPTLQIYDVAKLNVLLAVSCSICLLAYMLYTIAPETLALHGTKNLLFTVPIVAYGLFRYLFKAMEGAGDGPTEILVADPIFAVVGLIWGAAVLAALTWK